MLDISNWSKEQTHGVMLELLYSFNYMWFLMETWVKTHCPDAAKSEAFSKMAEQFGSYQAKRLEKTITAPDEGIDRLAAFLKRSHWYAFEDVDLEKISAKQLRMRTSGCTTQKAAKKWDMDHYDCGEPGLRLRRGFFSQIDPTAKVTRVFTPPDEKPAGTPDDINCEWIITID
jgi:hypothetical protein